MSLSPVARMEKSEEGEPRWDEVESMDAVRVNSACSAEQRPRGCARNRDFGLTPAGKRPGCDCPSVTGAGQVPPALQRNAGFPSQDLSTPASRSASSFTFANQDEIFDKLIIDKPVLVVVGQTTVPGRVCLGTKRVRENPPAATAARCHPPGKGSGSTPSARRE